MRLIKTILVAIAVMATCNVYSQKSELKPYINFLQKQNTSAVDYVFELFEDHDIVILGERDHRDMSQYELIKEIISDKRFSDNIGHIFTEVGVHNQTDRANKILSGTYEDYLAFEKDLMGLYRDLDYLPIWEKYNYWYLLSSIYKINSELSNNKKLDIHFTNPEFDWNNFIPRDSLFKGAPGQTIGQIYDSLMGAYFIADFNKILENNNEPRKKALVVFNSPHSYQNYQSYQANYWLNNAASDIFDYYPGRVANVMINATNFRKAEKGDYLFDNGKWDAAFRYLGNPELGFDMAGSPFGDVPFNSYDKPAHDTRFKDIFTGFIFYRPIHEWVLMIGIPGFVDDEFKPEYIRRLELTNKGSQRQVTDSFIKQQIDYANRLRWYTPFDGVTYKSQSRKEVDKTIEKWLK